MVVPISIISVLVIFFLTTTFAVPSITQLSKLNLLKTNQKQLIEGDFITSDQVRLHYWFYDQGTENVIVFLHGGPGHDTRDFRVLQAEQYANAFGSLIIFDQRGGGLSQNDMSLAANFTFDRLVLDIKELKNYLTPKQKLIIFARSFGGLLAMHFAQSQTDDVLGYILVSPGPLNLGVIESDRDILRSTVDKEKFIVVRNEEEEIVSKLIPKNLPTPNTDQNDAADDLDVGTALRNNEPSYSEDNYPLLQTMNNKPVLVIYGLYDLMVPPQSIERMRSYIPNATFKAMSGTHFAVYAQPEEFFKIISDWMGSNFSR